MPKEDRYAVGNDIKTVEYGWPIGMPVCKAIKGQKGLWEIRTNLGGNRIAKVLFCINKEHIVLLHGFIKKTQKTSAKELELAKNRKKDYD